ITWAKSLTAGGITFSGSTTTTAYSLNGDALLLSGSGGTANANIQALSSSQADQTINSRLELYNTTDITNNMAANMLILNGVIIGDGGLTVTGTGIVQFSNNNTYAGDTSIGTGQATGIARVTRSNPFGTTGTVTIGSAGNATAARLEIQDGRTIPNNINFSGRASATVGIENLSGTNNFGGTISAQAGGSFYLIQSDSGLVKLTGSNNGGVALNAGATGARTFTLQGAGDGSVNGSIANGSGTVSLNKNGAGTWTLSGSNSYTGGTTVTSGTLRIAPAAVASYSFDTVSGNTVMNTGNGGTAMNGTLANGASIVSGGRFGNAVSLSGSAYVNINNPVMDMGYVGNWTVSAWVKTTTAGSTILTKGDGTTWTTGNTIFYLGDGAGGGSGVTPSAVRYAGG